MLEEFKEGNFRLLYRRPRWRTQSVARTCHNEICNLIGRSADITICINFIRLAEKMLRLGFVKNDHHSYEAVVGNTLKDRLTCSYDIGFHIALYEQAIAHGFRDAWHMTNCWDSLYNIVHDTGTELARWEALAPHIAEIQQQHTKLWNALVAKAKYKFRFDHLILLYGKKECVPRNEIQRARNELLSKLQRWDDKSRWQDHINLLVETKDWDRLWGFAKYPGQKREVVLKILDTLEEHNQLKLLEQEHTQTPSATEHTTE